MVRTLLAHVLGAAVILLAAAAVLWSMPANACSGDTIGASWYGPGFHGRKTASGERFDQGAMTAAHKTLAFGTQLRVTYRGRSVVVRINDRGPYIRGRSLDLSRAAASRIGLIAPGHARVCVETLG